MSAIQAPGRRLTGLSIAVLAALAMTLPACKKEPAGEAATTAASNQPAAKPVEPPAQAVAAQVAAMTPDALREAASTALREQRLYAPAANNAVEYYLALRDKAPNDPAVSSALVDLMPYTLIATEQSIARDDFVEAQRLYALMEKADAKAPALPRLKQSIADAQASLAQRTADAANATEEEKKRQEEIKKQREADQLKQQQDAAKQLAAQQQQEQTQQAAAARAEQERQAAAAREAEQARQAAAAREAEQRRQQQAQAAAPAPAPERAAAPSGGGSNELRALSTPGPRYPADARRAGTSGNVQVEFTVGTDGSVTSARVVSADPPRVFDREALAAIKKWKFAPVNSPVTTRRNFAFNPGG